MTDISTQVREFAQRFEADLPPVDAASIIERELEPPPVVPYEQRRARNRAPGWAVALGTGMLVLLAGVMVMLLRSAGDSDEIAPVSPPSTQPGTVPESTADYSIVEDASYLNLTFGSTEPLEPADQPESGDWVYVTGPVGSNDGGLILYRRHREGVAGQREDLAVMLYGNVAVDGIRLTGDTSNLHLGLSCSGGAVILTSGGMPMNNTNRNLDEAIRAWRPGPDGTLEEFDPTTGESKKAC